jgi:hypothetical protein
MEASSLMPRDAEPTSALGQQAGTGASLVVTIRHQLAMVESRRRNAAHRALIAGRWRVGWRWGSSAPGVLRTLRFVADGLLSAHSDCAYS